LRKFSLFLVFVFGLAVASPAQSTTTYLPQIAVGTAGGTIWSTNLVVTNPAAIGTSSTSVTITFTKSDSSPLNIVGMYSDEAGNAVGTGNTSTFQLTGGQTRFMVTDDNLLGNSALVVGFATITSSAPVSVTALFVDGIANYSVLGSKDLARAGVTAAAPFSRQSIVVIKDTADGILQISPAVAFANPNSTAATVTFQILNTSGVAQFPSVTRTLPANNQTAIFVVELFPNLPPSFFGTMQITTSAQTPLAAMTLLFGRDGQFAAFPMVPLP
jgi:hypothetical protein